MTDEQLPDVAGTSAHDVDVYVPDPEHAALWARARSIGEMGELMARWLTGEISYQPGYAGPGPDSETRELVPVLAEVNRAGLVTDFSQPGVELDEHGNGQRAAVAGLCTQATAAWLRAAVRRTELVAVVRDLFSSAMVSLVVTLDEGEEYTWLGRGAYLDGYYEDLSPYLLAQLRAADLQYVEILDPRWGRNELLWATLNSALAERRDPSTAANGDRP